MKNSTFIPNRLFLHILLVYLVSLSVACSKEEEPDNPFDNTKGNGGPPSDSLPDPVSITGLHRNIFLPKCANPGCHDGTFEPDYRTVQSSFTTMVYGRVNKLTLDSLKFYTTRVIPGDPDASFLMERLLTTTSDYMPSNGTRLPQSDISSVRTWILNGCPDASGVLPQKPNLPPNITGYLAFNASLQRIDTVRLGGVSTNAFIAPANSIFYLPVIVSDTADGAAATDPQNFTVHEVRFSTDKNNFSNASTIVATWNTPVLFPIWQTLVNTSVWPPGTTVYFRIYVNDGFQPIPAEFPRSASLDFYKTYFSFIVQ